MSLRTDLQTYDPSDHVDDHNTLHTLHNLYEAITVDADDDASSIQTKIDAGPVVFMEDVSISDTLTISTTGALVNLNGHTLTSSGAPVFDLDGMREGVIRDGKVSATGGHAFRASDVATSAIRDVSVGMPGGASRSVWYQNGTDQAFDVEVVGGHWNLAEAISTPAMDVSVSSDLFAANVIAPKRITATGSVTAPVIQIEVAANNSGRFLYDNRFRDINFEEPYAGAIHAYSVQALRVENITVWDTHIGTIGDDMVYVGKRTGNDLSDGVLILGYHRVSGTIGSYYDIQAIEGFGIFAGGMAVIHPMGSTAVTLELDVEAGAVVAGHRVNEN